MGLARLRRFGWWRGGVVARHWLALLLAGWAVAGGAGQAVAQTSNATIFTTTTSITQTITTQTVTQRTDAYVTDILGKLNGGTIYDQSFGVAFSDPTVQAGIATARAAITTAGGPGVVITGPSLVSQNTALTSSTSQTNNVVQSQIVSNVVSTFIGPLTLPIGGSGVLGVCANAGSSSSLPSGCTGGTATSYALRSGQLDINTDTNTAQQILATTNVTNNYLTTAIYQLTGTIHPIGTVHSAVPEAGFDQAEHFSARLREAGLDDGTTAPGTSTMLSDASTGMSDANSNMLPPPSRWHSFLETYGYDTNQSASGGVPGDVRQSVGFDAGIGYDVNESLRIGSAFEFGATNINEKSVGESAKVDLSQIGIYAALHSWRAYGDITGTVGWGGASTIVAPPGLNATSSGHNGVWIASVTAESGYHVPLPHVILTPLVGVGYYHVETGGFTETGSALALAGAAHNLDRIKGWVGLSTDSKIAIARDTKLDFSTYGRLVALADMQHLTLPARFVGSPTSLFIEGANSGVLGVELGASLTWQMTRQTSLTASYDLISRQKFTAQAATAKFLFSF